MDDTAIHYCPTCSQLWPSSKFLKYTANVLKSDGWGTLWPGLEAIASQLEQQEKKF